MPELHSRRCFLRRSAAIAAGACTSLALAGDVNGGAAGRLKVGIVGIDAQGLALAQVARECGADIVAVFGTGEHRLAQLLAANSAAVRFDSARSMIDRAPLDAVIVNDCVLETADVARFALQRGRHVYSSPLGDSIAETRELGAMATESGLLTQVKLRSAGGDLVEHIVQPLQTGAIGRIREVVCWSNSCGWRDLLSNGQQILSVPVSALGLEHPTTIIAAGSTPPCSGFPEGMALRFAFPRSGSPSPLYVTWYDGAWAPPYESVDGIRLAGCGALYLGETGQLLDPQENGRAMRLRDGHPPGELPAAEASEHQSLRNWLAACAGQPRPLTGLERSAILRQTILAGLIAYQVQHPLDWDGPAMRARNCPQAAALIRSNIDDIGLA